ncbi:MAG: DUF819 family protein [Cardiobacteriaceae bacterium]|nr:DUF819 family protein [Cardiobacteriaceae bacterium]
MNIITTLPAAFGLLMGIVGFIFYTGSHPHAFWRRFYAIVPGIVLCCFVPAILNSVGVFASGLGKQIYGFSATYLLPASLFLMTLSMDVPKLMRLGWRVLAMFFAASLGIILGGISSIALFSHIAPDWVSGDHIWRGFSTIAGSWIGGAANMTAMKELYQVDDALFGTMLLIDATLASVWLFAILAMARHATRIDYWLKADTQSINVVIDTVEAYEREHARITTLNDLMMIIGLTFAVVGIAYSSGNKLAEWFNRFPQAAAYSLNSAFFWQVLIVTLIGFLLSFTRVRRLDHAGASKLGTALIFVLIAAIGMQIQLNGILQQWRLLLIAAVWMSLHIAFVFLVAKLIRAPLFFLCVGSNANTGGASSAAIVATAFHPSLAPVGVLLGILGYTIGTIGGYLTAEILRRIVT